MSGTLYGVGLGPGDPELITVKTHRLISNAKVVAYPAAAGVESFARRIAASIIPEGTEEISIEMPMVTARFPAQEIYEEAAKTIAARLEAGLDVVVLCEGDPFLYGSFMYLYERLMDQFPVEVVPGVSSVNACAAALGRPIASRNDVLTVIPGPLENDRMRPLIENAEAVVIMKVGRHLARIKGLLSDMNLLETAGYVERASLPEMQVKPLADLQSETAPYFSIILVYKGEETWKLPQQLLS